MIDVHTKLSTAVVCGDTNCKPLFTCQKALPSYCMWPSVAHTDTNFIPNAAGKQYYILTLSLSHPVVSYTCETPLQMFAVSHKLPPLLYLAKLDGVLWCVYQQCVVYQVTEWTAQQKGAVHTSTPGSSHTSQPLHMDSLPRDQRHPMSQGLISCGITSHWVSLQNKLKPCWCRPDPWGGWFPVWYSLVVKVCDCHQR